MSRRRILVVEDDPTVRDAVAEALADAGASVVLAVDGLDALERLRAGESPSVILLDLRMPRLDGESFLREIRRDARWESIPVITMTAGDDPLGGHVAGHLHKPFDLDDLLAIVLSLCDAEAA